MDVVRPSSRWELHENQSETEEAACTVKKRLQASICYKRETLGLDQIDLSKEEDKITNKEYSLEEELQKEIRRERNKLSARRCRRRKREERNLLKTERDVLISGNADLVKIIRDLNEEKQRLEAMLQNHNCEVLSRNIVQQTCRIVTSMDCGNTESQDIMSTLFDNTYHNLSYPQ